jgi:hypothetical protein
MFIYNVFYCLVNYDRRPPLMTFSRVYARYPDLLAEMFAYSMAAAHENLPHTTMMHYMISNTNMDEEGWKWIDALGEDVCLKPDSKGVYYSGKILPPVLHYCQFFRVGELGFQKRRIRKEIFACDKPMMVDPPVTLGTLDYKNRDGEVRICVCVIVSQ